MKTMRIVGFDHVQLAMPKGREEEAASFYQGLLGFDRLAKPAPLASRGGCWFDNGEIALHLGVQEDFRPATKAHPALLVHGLEELVDRLKRAGYDVEPDTSLPGPWRCYVHDPFGNRIELIEAS